MLEAKRVGGNYKMLVTDLVTLVTNIQKMSPTLKFSNQHPATVNNEVFTSATLVFDF